MRFVTFAVLVACGPNVRPLLPQNASPIPTATRDIVQIQACTQVTALDRVASVPVSVGMPAYSDDGARIAIRNDDQVRVYDATTMALLGSTDLADDEVASSFDGSVQLLEQDGILHVHGPGRDVPLPLHPPQQGWDTFSMTSDGRVIGLGSTLVIASGGWTITLELYDITEGKTLGSRSTQVRAAGGSAGGKISPNGKMIEWGTSRAGITYEELDTSKTITTINRTHVWSRDRMHALLIPSAPFALDWIPDAIVLDTATGHQTKILDVKGPEVAHAVAGALSTDGTLAALAWGTQIHVLTVAPAAETASFPLENVSGLAYSPSGDHLVATTDKEAVLFRTKCK